MIICRYCLYLTKMCIIHIWALFAPEKCILGSEYGDFLFALWLMLLNEFDANCTLFSLKHLFISLQRINANVSDILIVYYSIGFTKSTSNFWRQINKRGGRVFFYLSAPNFNAGFVKPTLCNIFSYILFNDFDWRNKT